MISQGETQPDDNYLPPQDFIGHVRRKDGTLYKNPRDGEEFPAHPSTKRLGIGQDTQETNRAKAMATRVDLKQELSTEPKFGNFGFELNIVKSPSTNKDITLAAVLEHTMKLQDAEL